MDGLPETDGELPAFWAALGLPGIVDVHVHAMPDRLQQKVWAYFDAGGPLLGRPWPVRYRFDLSTRLAKLAEFGVETFTSLLYPHKPGMARSLNEWAAEFAVATPGCLQTGTFFAEASAAGDVLDAVAAGARVFKAHVQVGGWDPRDPTLDGVWGCLAEAGVPVVVHCGGGPVPTAFTGPGPIGEVLARHPRLPAIIAHFGSPDYVEFLDLVAKYPATFLDTTGVFTDFFEEMAPFPNAELSRLADLGERILFGSDFPTIPYSYAEQVRALAALGFGGDWLRAVFRGNAQKLWPDLPKNEFSVPPM